MSINGIPAAKWKNVLKRSANFIVNDRKLKLTASIATTLKNVEISE